MSDAPGTPMYHEDLQRLRDALTLAEAESGFSSRLIEKDYYCSVLLRDLAGLFEQGLVFKGGTCLSKVHTKFFRLSEDLDFAVSVEVAATASTRRTMVSPFRAHFAGVPSRLQCFQEAEPLRGYNLSRQYNGRFAYRSVVTGEDEFIKVEISLREPILLPSEDLLARTVLLDPVSREPAVPPVRVRVLSLQEAYAEKVRAALTRREPAIRDFFDIDNAVQQKILDLRNRQFRTLLAQKLDIPGNDAINTSDEKSTVLKGQIETQLRPVLRTKDYEGFELQRVVGILREVVRLGLQE